MSGPARLSSDGIPPLGTRTLESFVDICLDRFWGRCVVGAATQELEGEAGTGLETRCIGK